MKRLILALTLGLSACVLTPAPQTHPQGLWDLSISISDPSGRLQGGAHVTLGQTEKDANDFGWAYFTVQTGCYQLRVEHPDFVPYAPADCVTVDRHKRLAVELVRLAPPTPRLTASGQIFYQDAQPWRWKGVTAFGLAHRFCTGEDITPFLHAVQGFNLLRVFLYVEWEGTGWTAPEDACLRRFAGAVAQQGFYVELTLLTGSKPISEAQQLINHYFTLLDAEPNVLIELVNEPHLYDKPDTSQLIVPPTHLLWASGDYDSPTTKMRGSYGVAHTPRDNEWPRKAHDLLEYYQGGGPGSPADPAHHFPQVADEPMRPDQAAYVDSDFAAYFGVASLLGAGATFHFESGKYGQPPTEAESRCALAALRALDFYPLDAPLGPYTRVDEHGGSLRTYTVGPYTVRVRPLSGPVLVPYQ